MTQPAPNQFPSQQEASEAIQHGEATRLGMDIRQWNERTEALMSEGARIITFRGAGTVNGIDPNAAEKATATLHEYVTSITADGTRIALMYDGDGDNRERPDVGSIFGGVVDSLGDNPHVTAIAAQTEGWYSPATENGAIESASGKPFETYVFPDALPGGHASLTQSDALVAYPGYEQVFVGPAGPIAFNQLGDLSQKAAAHRSTEAGPVKVTVLETPNNAAIGGELQAQLGSVADDQARAKIEAKITQREQQPYGALFTPAGEFAVDASQYPGVDFNVFPVK
jgi:hypothetical protein